jgi:hypothetical protein
MPFGGGPFNDYYNSHLAVSVDNSPTITAPPPTFEEDISEESSLTNFICCGVHLRDLHALLKHYEDHHIRFATDDDNNPNFGGTNPLMTRGRKVMAMDIEPYDFLPGHSEDDWGAVSAFDNTILRLVNPDQVRSQSAPMLGKTQFGTNPPNLKGLPLQVLSGNHVDQSKLIQSILSSTTIDPQSSSQNNNIATSIPKKKDHPYVCPVPRCGKSYKNLNGLKYHTSHGHDGSKLVVERPHKCPICSCGKKYKNPNGLKYHLAHVHNMARNGSKLVNIGNKKSPKKASSFPDSPK